MSCLTGSEWLVQRYSMGLPHLTWSSELLARPLFPPSLVIHRPRNSGPRKVSSFPELTQVASGQDSGGTACESKFCALPITPHCTGTGCTHIRSPEHPETQVNEFVVAEAERMPALDMLFASAGTPTAPHSLSTVKDQRHGDAPSLWGWACYLLPSLQTSLLPWVVLCQPEGPPPPGLSLQSLSGLLQQRLPAVKQFLPLDNKVQLEKTQSTSLTGPDPGPHGCRTVLPSWPGPSGPPSSITCITLLANLSNQPCSAFVSCWEEVPKASHLSFCKPLINSMLWQYREWIENLKFSRFILYASYFMYWILEVNKKGRHHCHVQLFYNLSTAYSFKCFDSITMAIMDKVLKCKIHRESQNSLDKSISTFTSKVLFFVFFLSNRFFFHILCPLSGRDSVSLGFPHSGSIMIHAEHNAGTNHFIHEKMQAHMDHRTSFSS